MALEHLRRRDLYDALGLARDAPAAEVAARADAERRRWMQKTQVTAEKTAWLEVVSHAQSHLVAPAARARYDRTLALEAEERLGESIAFALKGLPRLDYGTRPALIDEAGRRGIAPERADRLIARGCRALGVARDAATAAVILGRRPARLLRCRSCSGVTDFAERRRGRGQARVPPLPGLAPVGLPGLPAGRTGSTSPDAPAGSRSSIASRWSATSRPRSTRSGPATIAAALEHLERVQHYAPDHAGARKGIETVRSGWPRPSGAGGLRVGPGRRPPGRGPRGGPGLGPAGRPGRSPELLAARDEVARGLRMAQALARRGPGGRGRRPEGRRASSTGRPWRSPPTSTRPARGSAAARPTRPRRLVAEVDGRPRPAPLDPPAARRPGPGPVPGRPQAGGASRAPGRRTRIAEVAASRGRGPRRPARRVGRLRRLRGPGRGRLGSPPRRPGRSSCCPTCPTSASRPGAARSPCPGPCPAARLGRPGRPQRGAGRRARRRRPRRGRCATGRSTAAWTTTGPIITRSSPSTGRPTAGCRLARRLVAARPAPAGRAAGRPDLDAPSPTAGSGLAGPSRAGGRSG